MKGIMVLPLGNRPLLQKPNRSCAFQLSAQFRLTQVTQEAYPRGFSRGQVHGAGVVAPGRPYPRHAGLEACRTQVDWPQVQSATVDPFCYEFRTFPTMELTRVGKSLC
jgi:hypothetical protein